MKALPVAGIVGGAVLATLGAAALATPRRNEETGKPASGVLPVAVGMMALGGALAGLSGFAVGSAPRKKADPDTGRALAKCERDLEAAQETRELEAAELEEEPDDGDGDELEVRDNPRLRRREGDRCSRRRGRIDAKERRALPAWTFGLPDTRQYPLYRQEGSSFYPDADHAVQARARATQAFERGDIEEAERDKIDRRALGVLKRCELYLKPNPPGLAAERQKRELARRVQRSKEREERGRARGRIDDARLAKRQRVALANQECRDERERERVRLRELCARGRERAREEGDADIAAAREDLAQLRIVQKQRREGAGDEGAQRIRGLARARRRELAEESDDYVRNEYVGDSDTLYVWERVRTQFGGTPHERLEAFQEWMHEEPGEVSSLLAEHYDELVEGVEGEAEEWQRQQQAEYEARANPAGDELAAAADHYRELHWGDEPGEVLEARVPHSRHLAALGKIVRLDYLTRKKGEEAIWSHDFDDGPIVTVTPRGDFGPLVGGSARVTEAGIEG